MEMWWLFTTLMRYPRTIYEGVWARPFGLFFTFVVPILVVINVPAETMVKKAFDPRIVVWTMVSALAMLVVSRRFLRRALQSYRSASS